MASVHSPFSSHRSSAKPSLSMPSSPRNQFASGAQPAAAAAKKRKLKEIKTSPVARSPVSSPDSAAISLRKQVLKKLKSKVEEMNSKLPKRKKVKMPLNLPAQQTQHAMAGKAIHPPTSQSSSKGRSMPLRTYHGSSTRIKIA